MLDDLIAYAGHEVHVVRRREVRTLLEWAGSDWLGKRVLDVAGGDGYWAGRLRRRGALPVALDLARHKLDRGRRLRSAPALVEGDALALPFPLGSFDLVMSVCAIEHFDDGPQALAEMARVLRPGGDLVLSADTLSRADRWPDLAARHRDRYHVSRTYTAEDLAELMDRVGLELDRSEYLFRGPRAERLYFELSRRRLAWNLAAPLAPLVARSDRRLDGPGSVVLVHARKR